jgi:hypothetical protein
MPEFFRIYIDPGTKEIFVSDQYQEHCVMIKTARSMIEADADAAYFKELYESLKEDYSLYPDKFGKIVSIKFEKEKTND